MTIKYSGIIWAGIHVEDLNAATDFYQHQVELPLLREGNGYAHFDAGSGDLLELFSGGTCSSTPKSEESQSTMIALRVDNLADAEEVLRKRGIRFTDNYGTFENMSWATFVDLEGNCIEIKEIT